MTMYLLIKFVVSFLSIWSLNAEQIEKLDEDIVIYPIDVNQDSEKYALDGKTYTFFNILINYSEAELLCNYNGYRGRLAQVDTSRKFEFLAMVLADLDLEKVQQLWIGCHMNVTFIGNIPDKTVYCNNGEPISGKNSVGEGAFRTDITADQFELRWRGQKLPSGYSLCAILIRKMHFLPMFSQIDCKAPRGFICEEESTTLARSVIADLPFKTSNGARYQIFHGKVTWEDAINECRDFNMQLATFKSMEEVGSAYEHMVKARPGIENLWIGGKYNENQQKWIFIPNSKIINNNTLNGTKFPPWENNTSSKTNGCLTLDRHAKNPYFRGARCNQRLSFICERAQFQETLAEILPQTNQTDYNYVLVHLNRTWLGASQFCHKLGLILIEPRNSKKIKEIVLAMRERNTVVSHVWLGGRIRNKTWHWSSSNEIIANTSSDPEYPPLISEPGTFSQCLNMDVEEINQVVWYGMDCNTVQNFICQKGPNSSPSRLKVQELLDGMEIGFPGFRSLKLDNIF